MPDYKKLDELKQKLDSFRPLPPEMVKNLHEDLVVRWTYHSNAIEGNTLTLKETKVALEGITFSTFALESSHFMSAGDFGHALANFLANNILGVTLVFLGMWVGRLR